MRNNLSIVDYQSNLLIKGLSRYSTDLSQELSCVFRDWESLDITHPNAITEFCNIFNKYFLQMTGQSEVFSCCLIDECLDFGSFKENFKPNKAKRHFKKVLKGLDYIGIVTFAQYKNTSLSLGEGMLRSVHCHFLIIGDKKPSRKQRWEIKSKIVNNRDGHIPLLIKKYPLAQATGYAWKSPIYTAYSTVYDYKTGKVKNFRSKPSLKKVFEYFQKFKGTDIYAWTIAGGKGCEIWEKIKSELELHKESKKCQY